MDITEYNLNIIDLIGQIYEASLNGELWSMVARQIVRLFESVSAGIVLISEDHTRFIARTPELDDGWVRDYLSYFCRVASGSDINEIPASWMVGTGCFVPPPGFWLERRLRSPVSCALGSVITIREGQNVVFGLHRAVEDLEFNEDERARLAHFLPHLRRGLQLRDQLTERGLATSAALERLNKSSVGTIVVGQDGQVYYTNPAARALLAASAPLGIVGGRISISNRTLGERLMSAIGHAALSPADEEGKSITLSVPREHDRPLTMLVRTLRSTDSGNTNPRTSAILFIRDPAARRLAPEPLQSLFGLTAAEAHIASALAEGRSLEEISTAFSISRHTARVHLKSVFAKTATNRQAELVALLLSSVAKLAS